jgi:signal transduction histidine kinase
VTPSERAEGEALAIAAHELRSPLATLCATAELLHDHPDIASADARSLIARLHRSVVWMSGLVDNLETWTALQDNRLMLDRRPTSMDEWIEPALEVTHAQMERCGQRVHLYGPAPIPRVLGDPRHLGQILVNLLTNASRYSDPGDVIEVRVTADSECVCVRVTDHGPGIPFDEQCRIFDRYVRGSRAAEAEVRGKGLGLYIVQRLVTLQRGSDGVDSYPGEGSTFWFTIPRAADDTANAPVETNQEHWRIAG